MQDAAVVPRSAFPAEAGDEGAEVGFTLVELMVVLLIMAILLAIAIPTFLGVQTSANYRSTQSDLVNAAISAKDVFASSPVDMYPTGPSGQTGVSLVAMLQSTEPELSFTTNPVTYSLTPHALYVAVSTDGRILFLAAQSKEAGAGTSRPTRRRHPPTTA